MKNNYKKAFRVIMSCETHDQLVTAAQWVERIELTDIERESLREYVDELNRRPLYKSIPKEWKGG